MVLSSVVHQKVKSLPSWGVHTVTGHIKETRRSDNTRRCKKGKEEQGDVMVTKAGL